MGEHVGISNVSGAAGLLVDRPRLVRRIFDQLGRGGVLFICAPSGFGKTALLMQCIAAAEANPEMGPGRLVDVRGMDTADLLALLDGCERDLGGDRASLLALDNISSRDDKTSQLIVERLRALRDAGISVICSCVPTQRGLVGMMGDSSKMNASALLVRPDEYAGWVRAFGISSELDVYGLTQGVAALVVALRGADGTRGGGELLERAVTEVYGAALDGLVAKQDPLLRLVCLMIMMGRGSVDDLERCGLRIKIERLSHLKRDYPMIEYDPDTRGFRCLGEPEGALALLRERVAGRKRSIVLTATKALLKADRVDDAVAIMERYLGESDRARMIEGYPMKIVLHGHASFVRTTADRIEVDPGESVEPGLMLAAWAASLLMGDYRAARAASSDLRRRADDIEGSVSPEDWREALALGRLWEDCRGVSLPELSVGYVQRGDTAVARRLWDCVEREKKISRDMMRAEVPAVSVSCEDGLVLPDVLERLEAYLIESVQIGPTDSVEADAWLAEASKEMVKRRLIPLALKARSVASVRRLMSGRPVVDEQSFTDASRTAVRESNLRDQLMYLVLEGWQYLAIGQAVNAEFRAQQVQKLGSEEHKALMAWAMLLERVAAIYNSSRLSIRQEADLFNLADPVDTPEEAWAVALHLSAAKYDADLAAWYSMHRSLMLRDEARSKARLAMHLLGERADSMRRLLPRRLEREYMLGEEGQAVGQPSYDHDYDEMLREVGQVSIDLFGGFHAVRNGHVLTDEIWKRHKATFLAARLVLARGNFVNRRVLMEELWPDAPYERARQNLYVTLSALRQALCQQEGGPQYIVTQAGAVAVNNEYVSCDLIRFDLIARDVLLKRTGISSRQIVEACLKLEEVYKGSLFIPDVGNVRSFVRMAEAYERKFVDCMIRGIDAALEDEDIASASWLVDAAMKVAPTREDVVRHAMKVMGLEGRRREVVELYNGHLYYLKHELEREPEEETKKLYSRIVGSECDRAMI